MPPPARRVIGLDWRTPIAAARKRLGPGIVVQGNLDPALVLAGRDVAARRRATPCSPTTPATRATSSTSATACTPTPTPACSPQIVEPVHAVDRRTRAAMTGGRRARDGVRHAALAATTSRPYYTDIRRGRPPTTEQLADLTAATTRSAALSPLAERTEAQRRALAGRARRSARPGGFVVVLGLQARRADDRGGVDALAARGVDRIVGLVLAPHYSALSVGQYLERAARGGRGRAA